MEYFYSINKNKVYVGDKANKHDIELSKEEYDGFVGKALVYNNEQIGIDMVSTINQARADMVKAIEAHIQIPINDYNKANNTLFESVHNCATYLNVPTYTHYEFCEKIVKFNVDVWEKGRSIEAEVLAGIRPMPTLDELIDELPVFN